MKLRSARRGSAGVVVAVALACLASLTGCSQQTLYSKLDEREANEEVALLREAGIQASKVARDGAYAVTVPDGDLARSTLILREHGLPRQGFGNRCTLFKREGFVTTTLQEHELKLCAISQEISHALMALNGVLDARVVLDVPVRNPLIDKAPPPKASVVVKFRHGVDADALKSNVKRVVVHSVDGLNHDNVSVEHSMADARPVVPLQTAASNGFAQAVPWPLAVSSGVGLAALFGGVALWWNRRRNAAWPAEPEHGLNHATGATGLSLRARVTGSLARAGDDRSAERGVATERGVAAERGVPVDRSEPSERAARPAAAAEPSVRSSATARAGTPT